MHKGYFLAYNYSSLFHPNVIAEGCGQHVVVLFCGLSLLKSLGSNGESEDLPFLHQIPSDLHGTFLAVHVRYSCPSVCYKYISGTPKVCSAPHPQTDPSGQLLQILDYFLLQWPG